MHNMLLQFGYKQYNPFQVVEIYSVKGKRFYDDSVHPYYKKLKIEWKSKQPWWKRPFISIPWKARWYPAKVALLLANGEKNYIEFKSNDKAKQYRDEKRQELNNILSNFTKTKCRYTGELE